MAAHALVMSFGDVHEMLRSGSRHTVGWRSRAVRDALVIGQVALAVIVLAAAALVGRSLQRLTRVDLAFRPSQVVVAELALSPDRFATAPQQVALLERLVRSVGALPGVQGVSPVVSVPWAGTRSWAGRPSLEGQTPDEAARNPMIDMEVVSPSFFSTIGLPIVRGRAFSDADGPGAPLAVILSQSAAAQYWPGENPIGKRLAAGAPGGRLSAVVGIVPDTRYRDLRAPHATIYFPLRQSYFPFAPTTLVVRARRTPADVAVAIRSLLAATEPGAELGSASGVAALLQRPLAEPRLNALLLAIFAAASVVLAGVGIFALLGALVRQRTRELGIRMALGARPASIRRLVAGRGVLLAGAGTLVGLAASLVADRALASILFKVSPSDPQSLAAVAAFVLVVAAVASVGPARAGTRIDPAIALRAE